MTAQRMCDVFLALVLLVICLPVMSVACLLLVLETQTVPFVLRIRVTPDGRIVRVIQLRADFDKRVGLPPSALARVVRQLHIDQVPQLLSVLAGDLSLVGPGRDVVGQRSLLAWRER